MSVIWGLIVKIFNTLTNGFFQNWSNYKILPVITDVYNKYSFGGSVSRVAKMISQCYLAMPPCIFYLDSLILMFIVVLIIIRIIIDLL